MATEKSRGASTENGHGGVPKRVAAVSRPVEIRTAADLPYEDYLREYVGANKPVVIQGGVARWPALGKWTPEFFKKTFATRPVQVSFDKSMSFSEFVDAVLASTNEKPGPYMYRLFLHEHLPEVLADLSPQNPYGFPRRYASPLMLEYYRRPDGYLKLLFGGIGGRFPVMHFDGDAAHATITEIYGDKEFILYPEDDTPYLYANPERPNHSLVDDPMEQDHARFPLLARATQYRAVLKPGDTIFVPRGWWHAARALTVSISVCTNMVDDSNWDGFVDETTKPNEGRNPRRQRLKRAYLKGAGRLMSLAERAQERFPMLAKALLVPARISPATSEMARDPSTIRLKIRYPTV